MVRNSVQSPEHTLAESTHADHTVLIALFAVIVLLFPCRPGFLTFMAGYIVILAVLAMRTRGAPETNEAAGKPKLVKTNSE